MAVFAVFDLYRCPQLFRQGKRFQHSVFPNMIGKKEKREKTVTYQCMGASCLCPVVHGEGGVKSGYCWIFAKDINVVN